MMSDDELKAKRWKKEGLGVLIMLGTWLGFFWRQLFDGAVYFFGDIGMVFYPLEFVYGVWQQARHLPIWSSEFGFGHPLLSWGQLGFFTPLHVLLREIGLLALDRIQVSMMVHFALGLLGMYIWLRRRNYWSLAAALGAIVFVFNGYNVSHIVHLNFFIGVMLLPWGLVSLDALMKKVTLGRVVSLSFIVAVIVLSAHAQIALYCLLLIVLVGVILIKRWTFKLGLGLVTAAVLGVMLSSLVWWPLIEFLPYQDRTEGMTAQELYNFSYPPEQAITLILPTYFGSLGSYWGANSYLELGSFVGLVPLLLAGIALASKQGSGQRDKIAAITAVGLGWLLTLGQYSFVYRFFVNRGWWPPFTAPGRWLLLVVFGIAWLSAMGLNKMAQGRSRKEALRWLVIGVLLVGLTLLPFGLSKYIGDWQSVNAVEVWLAVMGVAVMGVGWMAVGKQRWIRVWSLVVVLLVSVSLVYFGWRLYPVIDRAEVTRQSFVGQEILKYNQKHVVPARLYSDKVLLRKASEEARPEKQEVKRTGLLNKKLAVHQLVRAEQNDWSCVNLGIESSRADGALVEMLIRKEGQQEIIRREQIRPAEVTDAGRQMFCFEPIKDSVGQQYLISWETQDESGQVQLLYRTDDEGADGLYLVRVERPTAEQYEQSKKSAQLLIELVYGPEVVDEQMLMFRHLNATVGASGARWVGSISIRRYRDFVKELFANDKETVDGDGEHILSKNRRLFDLAGVTRFAQGLEEGATDAMLENGFRLVKEEKVRGVRYRLYENEQALPRAFVVPKAILETSRSKAFSVMQQEDFDPRRTVYLEDPKDMLTESDWQSVDQVTGEVEVIKYEPTSVDVKVDIDQAGWLVLTDTFTPLWQVWVDDKPAPQLVADQLWRATKVPAGKHVVSWRYRSRAVEQAQWLTAAGVLLSLVLLALSGLNMRNWLHDRNTT